ncbi:hypothetical protein [Roseovarius sp. MMSF_3281]|uniref:hypothetical protein n=1 Tax=Roseovarius sp. MMSF_3281 TaxID=3046694 RepID=UPI00274003EB|nr:hypothetical protein [Roseovarius sp. MMSF_3281]
MRIPTVKVIADHPRGYMIINKADFDPEVHELFENPKRASADSGAKQPANVKAAGNDAGSGANEAQKPQDTGNDGEVDMSDVEAMTWPQLRSAAAEVSDSPISTKEDAIDAIRAHREKKAASDGGAD